MTEKRFVSGEVLSIEHVVLTDSIDCFGMKKNTIETIVTVLEKHNQQNTYQIKTGTADFKIGDVVGFYLNEDGYHVDVILDDRSKYKTLIENENNEIVKGVLIGISLFLLPLSASFVLMNLYTYMINYNNYMTNDNPMVFLLSLFAIICFSVFIIIMTNYEWSQNGKDYGVCEEDKINMKAFLEQQVKYFDCNKQQKQVDAEQLINLK
jgi:hypothetical protein